MKFTLIKKIKETEDINTFILRPEKNFKWKAGQYLIYTLNHKNPDIRGKMRFFTVSASPFEKYPSITTKIIKKSSSFKKALNNLVLGQTIEAKGPDGDFVIENPKKKYVFVAGGIGITPFRSILKQLEFENKDLNIILLYSGKNNNVVFRKEFENLKLKNLKIKYFIGKRIGKADIGKISGFKKRIFFCSGPDPMVAETEKLLSELGVKKENIKSDYFSGYSRI